MEHVMKAESELTPRQTKGVPPNIKMVGGGIYVYMF